jgi:hypothetical protein
MSNDRKTISQQMSNNDLAADVNDTSLEEHFLTRMFHFIAYFIWEWLTKSQKQL